MPTKQEIQSELNRRSGAPSQDAIRAELESRKSSNASEPVGGLDALEGFGRSMAQGATWNQGSQAIAGLAAVGSYPFTGEPVGQAYDRLLAEEVKRRKSFEESNPILSTVGELTGAITGGGGAAKGIGSLAPKLTSKLLTKAGTNFGTKAIAYPTAGYVSGASYEMGDVPEEGKNRYSEANKAGLVSGVLAPVGVVASPLLSSLGKAIDKPLKSLTTRAKGLLGGGELMPMSDNVVQQRGGVFPLTKGQSLQQGEAQSMENMARSGALGSKPQEIMAEFDNNQQQEISDYLGTLSGGAGDDVLSSAGKMVQESHKGLNKAIRGAYDDAKVITQVYLNKKPFSDTLVPKIKRLMSDEGFDPTYYSAKSKNLISQVLDNPTLKDESITALNMGKLETWRKQVSRAIDDNTVMGKMNEEAVSLSKIKNEFDGFMSELPRDALKSGDNDALKLILSARSLRAEKGRVFDRVKVIKDIVGKDELTNEELANMVLSGSKRSGKINSSSGRLVADLKRSVGDKAPELQESIKRGVISRLIKDSRTPVLRGDVEELVLQPNRIAKNIDNILENKTFAKEVFSKEELASMRKASFDLRKIGSTQKGADNYSNTAYTLAKMMPFGLSDSLKSMVSRFSVADDISLSVQQFVNEFERELAGNKKFYGAMIPSPIASDITPYIESQNIMESK